MPVSLKLTGEVQRPQELSFDQIAALGESRLVIDVPKPLARPNSKH
jgi:hypothetical protein